MLYDVIVAGSGAAGTWAAFGAARLGLKTLVVDVGLQPKPERRLEQNIFELRRTDINQRQYLIGDEYESLHNLYQPYLSPKLKAPRYRYVIAEPEASMRIKKEGFDALQSFAYGGLASAWGAGTYRYDDDDLRKFPFTASELDPYYDAITREIGITGTQDDLQEHFGSTAGLQTPLKLDRLAQRLLNTYQRKKKYYNARGIKLGYPRLAILSRALGDRTACAYDNLSFWQPQLPSIYSPAMTLDQLLRDKKIEYLRDHLVIRYSESDTEVSVETLSLKTKTKTLLKTRRFILAAGALNSAKIVLRSHDDYQTQLPLLENPTSMVPLVSPWHIGQPVERQSHGLIQLNLIYQRAPGEEKVQASIYGYSSPLGSDAGMNFPLAIKAVMASCKYVLPSMLIVQLFYADSQKPGNYVQLASDQRLVTRYEKRKNLGKVEGEIIRTFLRAGLVSHSRLVQYPPPGNGIHYAGTLPMTEDSTRPYTTTPQGRLAKSQKVYVADASIFPCLPAKNHTLTIMANALRTAYNVAETLRP